MLLQNQHQAQIIDDYIIDYRTLKDLIGGIIERNKKKFHTTLKNLYKNINPNLRRDFVAGLKRCNY